MRKLFATLLCGMLLASGLVVGEAAVETEVPWAGSQSDAAWAPSPIEPQIWLDSSWTYRKSISVTSTGTLLTNYQVKATVAYAAGMQADFDDLRFTAADGATPVDFWLEAKTDSVSATVWIEVPSIPAAGGTSLYMYFGNAAAASGSNGANTFQFFDDFLGTTLDAAKWAESSNSGTYSVAGGILTTTSSGGCELIKSVPTFPARNVAFHVRGRSTGSSGYFEYYLMNFNPSGDPYGSAAWYRYVDGYDYGEQIARRSVSEAELFRAAGTHFTSWTHFETAIGSSTISLGWDGSQKASEACAFGASDSIWLDIGEWAGSSAYYDWAFVSKYASPAPTAVLDSSAQINPSSWQYRKPITIDNTGNANAFTYFQVKIAVSYATGMQPDFDDLRFVSADGTTLIDHWLESKVDSSTATVWAEIPSIPASARTTVYMYYGNAAATSASNGNATFNQFDDFWGTALDASKWTVAFGGNSYTGYTVSGGCLNMDLVGAGSSIGALTIKSNTLVSSSNVWNYVYESRVFADQSGGAGSWAMSGMGVGVPNSGGGSVDNKYLVGWNGCTWHYALHSYSGAVVEQQIATTDAAWHTYYLRLASTTSTTAKMDSSTATGSWSIGTPTSYETILGGQTEAMVMYNFDWFRVRKYANPEPAASVGYAQLLNSVQNVNTGEYFNTIQTAIDDSDTLSGHLLKATAWTYYETLTVNKRLTIRGAGMGNTTINGGNSGSVVTVTANWVNLTGFKITASGTSGSTPNMDAGVKLSSVQYCNISGNNITGNRNGVNINGGGYHRISGNQIRTSGYDAIYAGGSTYNRMDNNTIISFSDCGVWLQSSSSYARVENNTISTGTYGIYLSSTNLGSVFQDNIITKTAYAAMYLSGASSGKILRNTVISNTDVGLYLSDSQSFAISNNTVKWNNGTYGGIFLEYANSKNCIISYNTVMQNSRDGIRIRQGANNKIMFNNITGNAKSGSGYVGGIHLLEADYNTMANNSLYDNIRGITLDGWNDYNIIDNNTVNYSTSTGMVFSYSYNNIVKYSTFYRNAGTGISVGNSNTNTFSRNQISYNTGDGIWIGVGGHKVLNNTLHHNAYSGLNVSGNPSSGNTPANLLDGNNASYNSRDGITIWDSTSWAFHTYQNTISNTKARGNSRTGISLNGGTYMNVLMTNNASGNLRHGITLDNAPDSTVINNTVAFNGQYGMYVTGTASSKIYKNNILSNTNQAYENGDNVWNLGYAGGGNHWSDWTSPDDYSGTGQDVAGADGFVDLPRAIPGGTNRDWYPWTDINGWYGYTPSTGPVVNINTGEFFFLIQDAINDPQTLNGHTITVAAGTYFENPVVNKRLTIIGAGAGTTLIRGGGSSDVITVSASWVNVTGFRITNGGSTGELAGIKFNSVSNCNVSACTVSANLRHGIYATGGSLNSIFGCTVSGNAGNGIYLASTSNCRVAGCTIDGNLGAEGGVYLASSSYNTITGNIIRNLPLSGIMLNSADYNKIVFNTITNTSNGASALYVYRSGIYLYSGSGYNQINNNTLYANRMGMCLNDYYNVMDNNTVSYSAASGMTASYASYNTVKYCTFHHNAGNGISMGNSDHNTFSRNMIYSNAGEGISFSQGGYHKVLNNTITNNALSGVNMTGSNVNDVRLCHLDGNNVSYNNHNGITLYDSTSYSQHVFFENVTNNVAIRNNRSGINVVGGAYANTLRGNTAKNNLRWGVYLSSSPNNKVISNVLTYNTNDGLGLFSSSGITATGNNASSNGASGFILYSSTGCSLANNTLYSNYIFGLNIGTSSNGNALTGNTASKNGIGICISWSSNSNTISQNTANQNTADGAYIDKSSSNTIFNNTFSGNTRWGLWFGWSGSSNKVYHNNFVGNTGGSAQAEDNMGTNLWDNGYPGGGNYWSNYPGIDAFSGASQNVPGSDGFGDTPYAFTGSQDRYPLMFQSVWWAEVAPVVALVSPADGSVIQAGTALNFYVWDQDFNLDHATYAVDSGPDTAFGLNYDIDTTGWADGDCTVAVDASDKLGNTVHASFGFRIDSTDPTFTAQLAMTSDAGSDGFVDTGDALAIWVNVTDANEDATTAPSINVDETGFQNQPVSGLAYHGAGVWSSTYTVKAGGFNVSDVDVTFADKAGNSVTALDSPTFRVRGVKAMTMAAGWALISFPMDIPTINGARVKRASDLANHTSAVMVSKWSAAAQKYTNYIPGFHTPTDPENFAIGPDDAVFVYSSGGASVSVSGYRSEGQRSVGLSPGWNLVGYHSMDEGDAEDDWAAQVSCGPYDDICWWDGATFQHYIFAGTEMKLVPGRGYFVWSDAATTLVY